MTTLPLVTFLDVDRSAGEMQSGMFGPMLDVQAETPGGGPEQALTIDSGSITPAKGASRSIVLSGEGSADDDLDSIDLANVPDGGLLILRGNGSEVITLKHGQGSSGRLLLRDGVDYSLDSAEKHVALQRRGTDVVEVFRNVLNVRKTVATTSGTAPQILGITENANRIAVNLDGVSTDGPSQQHLIQVGTSAGFVTSGYVGVLTSGFRVGVLVSAAEVMHGMFTLELVDPAAHIWQLSGQTIDGAGGTQQSEFGQIDLPGKLDRIRVTTVGGTAAYDAGGFTIRVEE